MNYIIESHALCKRYKDKLAVDHVSIHIRKGEIYGLIGKNGAGKTSLMKLLLGDTFPDSGNLKLFGSEDLQAGRQKIGALIEAPAFYKNETASENLKRFSLLSETMSDKQLHALLQTVGLAQTGKKKAGSFSLGMRQRLGIAIALLGNPELLILDEPINGLDPAGIKEIRDLIIKLHQQGVTILISSHLLDELGKIATCYGIVNNGVLIDEISNEELKQQCHTSLVITVDQIHQAKKLIQQELINIPISYEADDIIIKNHNTDASMINELLVKNGIRVYGIKKESITFEDYFMERINEAYD